MMNIRRWGIGGVAAIGVVAAACGGSGAFDSSEPATGDSSAAPAPAAASPSQEDQAADAATEDQALNATATDDEGLEPVDTNAGRTATSSAGLFLPPDAEVTPDGESIIRAPASPIFFGAGWNTNWDLRIIELTELIPGGPPRDGIPSIDNPKFITVVEADGTYTDNAPVVQFEINGDVRAYPLDILTWHEIVNDVVGGVPVAITFCPLCNTAIAFERQIGGIIPEFGTSGLLRRSDLVMYDRITETLWQQIGGKALVGDFVGAELNLLAAPIVSWGQFKEAFPDGIVLSRDTGFVRSYGSNPYTGYDDINNTPFLFAGKLDKRLSPFERVVTLDLGNEFVAYPFILLEDVRAFQDTRQGREIVVFWTPGTSSALDTRAIEEGREVGATGVFVRELDGQLLDFKPNPDDDQTFVDEQTGSVWNIFGKAIAGPMNGAGLEPVVHANHFWFAWAAFQPDTEIVIG